MDELATRELAAADGTMCPDFPGLVGGRWVLWLLTLASVFQAAAELVPGPFPTLFPSLQSPA